MRHYITWHYTRALTDYWHVAKNLLWFVINFFSLPQLTKSIFAPFRRITEERGDRFSFEDLAGYVIIGIISRIIGFILRLTIILAGTAATLSLLVLIITTYVFWLIAPVALITLFVLGIKLLITPS
jgi:hypothetical protein